VNGIPDESAFDVLIFNRVYRTRQAPLINNEEFQILETKRLAFPKPGEFFQKNPTTHKLFSGGNAQTWCGSI
jgi:hypothetical protein